MEPEPSDEDLMLRYQRGDAASFDVLYGRHRGGVFRFLLRQCASRTLAEELLQEVWIGVVQARSKYSVEAKFTTFLYTLARNRAIDHFRRNRSYPVRDASNDDDIAALPGASTEQPERKLQLQEQTRRLLKLIEALPAAQREVFLLHEEGALTLEQIGGITGASRETVKSRLRYALDKLREGMKGYL